MTNFQLSRPVKNNGFAFSKPLVAVLFALPCIVAQAQTLKPSTGPLRLSTPSAINANPAGGGQRAADFIVVVVNSEPVTNNEVRSSLLRAEQQLTQAGSAMPPRNELARQVLERLISDRAQLQEARLSGLRIDDSSLENAVQSVAQQNRVTVDELRKRVAADGLSYARFLEGLRDELLVSRFRQREVEARVRVTESDIDQFLREQESGGDASLVEINLAQILIGVPENATPEQVTSLQARAQAAADKARSGADFAALVIEFASAATREAGGQMGLRSAERYPALFVDAVKNLTAGAIAGPIRSGAGFHVLKLIEKKQAGMPSVNITQTRARHILLRASPQLNEAAATAKLADIRKKIAGGQNFAALAKENSDDGSASQGGDLGWANPGMFVPEFEQVMNSLAPGQISEPLVSRFGVHLIQVMERREAQLTTREQRELARSVLREKKQEEAYALWAQDVRGRAYVEYREPPQ